MPTRNGKRTRPPEDEIERILREAEEVLREAQAPSGGWPEARPGGGGGGGEWGGGEEWSKPEGWSRSDAGSGSWPGIGEQGIDAEAAFWLLFPPRGNA